MRFIAARLAAEVRAIAVVGAVLCAKAPLRSPRLNQRAIDREVFIAHKLLGAQIHFGKEPLRHFAVQ